MMGGPTDLDSARALLERVHSLAGRLDLHHPDPDYQAQKADQLAEAAHQLAHDLRLIGSGRGLHTHLRQLHAARVGAFAAHPTDAWMAIHNQHHRDQPTLDHPHHPDLAPSTT
jgi:hypothetical protein